MVEQKKRDWRSPSNAMIASTAGKRSSIKLSHCSPEKENWLACDVVRHETRAMLSSLQRTFFSTRSMYILYAGQWTWPPSSIFFERKTLHQELPRKRNRSLALPEVIPFRIPH